MKEVNGNVIYSIGGVKAQVADNATHDEIREALFTAADAIMDSTEVEIIIEQCSIPELND